MSLLVLLRKKDDDFSPLDISDLTFWVDADDSSTITETLGAVSQWDDKSGNDYHLTQSTSSAQPTTGTRTMNSRNVLDFSTGDFINTSSDVLNTTSARTIFSVSLADSISSAVSTRLLATRASGSGMVFGYSSPNLFTLLNDGNLSASFVRRKTTSGDFSISSAYILHGTWDGGRLGAGITLTKNGGSLSYSVTEDSEGLPVIGDGLCIGAEADGLTAAVLDGVIAETLMYSRVLTSSETNQVGKYLAAKWGMTWTDI